MPSSRWKQSFQCRAVTFISTRNLQWRENENNVTCTCIADTIVFKRFGVTYVTFNFHFLNNALFLVFVLTAGYVVA
jgi:hypothetical protein